MFELNKHCYNKHIFSIRFHQSDETVLGHPLLIIENKFIEQHHETITAIQIKIMDQIEIKQEILNYISDGSQLQHWGQINAFITLDLNPKTRRNQKMTQMSHLRYLT